MSATTFLLCAIGIAVLFIIVFTICAEYWLGRKSAYALKTWGVILQGFGDAMTKMSRGGARNANGSAQTADKADGEKTQS